MGEKGVSEKVTIEKGSGPSLLDTLGMVATCGMSDPFGLTNFSNSWQDRVTVVLKEDSTGKRAEGHGPTVEEAREEALSKWKS